MKKSVLVLSLTMLFFLTSLNLAFGQDQPKPKKDTVNMDTNAKPTYYYPVEDSKKGSGLTIALIAGAVVVVGGVAFFVLKRKK
jgi:hypothetical protein